MTNQFKKKEVWLNTYPIFLWLVSEPLVGLIDSKIASYIDIDVLSAVGIGETVYFVFIWIFVFLAYGTTPYVSNLQATKQIHKLNYFITFGRKSSVLIGLISAGLLIFASTELIKFFEPTKAVSSNANSYLILRSLGLPFYLLISTQTQTSNFVKSHEKKEISKKFFSIGFYIFIRSMFLTLFMAYLRNQASLMSMSEIALQHVLLQLWSFGYVFVDALAIAAQTLVAEQKAKFNNYKNSELKKYLNSLTFKIAIFLFITSFIFLENIVLLITEASLVLIIDNELKTLFALSLLIGSFAFLWDGVLLGLDKSKQFSIMTVIASLIGFLSCIYLLSQDNSLSSLWIGLNLSLLYRGLVGFY